MRSRYNSLPSYKYADVEGVSPVFEKSEGKPMRDYRVYGNSYQKPYGGKNLFDVFNQEYSPSYNRCLAEVLEDGILRVTNRVLSGYTTASCYLPYYVSDFVGKTITISFKTNSSNSDLYSGVSVRLENSDNTAHLNIAEKFSYGSSVISFTKQITETHQQKYEKIKLNFYTNATGTAIGEIGDYVDFSDIQLEIGDIVTEYEEYIPAPSIDYPQDIECVGDKTKNLFDVEKFVELVKIYDDTATETVVDGRRCISFRNDKLYHKDFSEVVNFDEGLQYTWTMDIKHEENLNAGDNMGEIYFGWIYNDETYDTTNVANGTTPRGTRRCKSEDYTNFSSVQPTSVTGRNVSQIGFSYGYRARWLIDLDSIQIEEGTVATDYEPYGKYKMCISVISDDKSDFYNIYLDEPLRKVGDVSDYIDYKNQKFVRNIEVLDDTGTLPIEESYGVLNVPLEQSIELPLIETNKYTNTVNVHTKIKPGNVLIQYYKKG